MLMVRSTSTSQPKCKCSQQTLMNLGVFIRTARPHSFWASVTLRREIAGECLDLLHLFCVRETGALPASSTICGRIRERVRCTLCPLCPLGHALPSQSSFILLGWSACLWATGSNGSPLLCCAARSRPSKSAPGFASTDSHCPFPGPASCF